MDGEHAKGACCSCGQSFEVEDKQQAPEEEEQYFLADQQQNACPCRQPCVSPAVCIVFTGTLGL